jgi:uncharacterized membrane protein
MSSLELDAQAKERRNAGTLFRLLDPAFGLCVWAVHFLAVYVAAALACALGAAAGSRVRWSLTIALGIATVAAVALVLLHAMRRYRQQRRVPDLRFRMSVTAGCDSIAAVAIAWQLFPILLVPMCA